MNRRHFTANLAALALMSGLSGLFGHHATAQPAALNGEEVIRLLTGNTAVGMWEGTPYRSYFGSDGVTIYAVEGAEPQIGKWRVNPATGQYESFWQAVGWTEYSVLRTDTGYAWLQDGMSYPFTVIEGQALAF